MQAEAERSAEHRRGLSWRPDPLTVTLCHCVCYFYLSNKVWICKIRSKKRSQDCVSPFFSVS